MLASVHCHQDTGSCHFVHSAINSFFLCQSNQGLLLFLVSFLSSPWVCHPATMLDGGLPSAEDPPHSEQLSLWNLATSLCSTPSTDSKNAQDMESTSSAPPQNVASCISEQSAAGPPCKSTSKSPNLPQSPCKSMSKSPNLPPSRHNLKWHLRPPPTPRFCVHTTVLLGEE